jgi:CDP-glycerol glycerophosphotransferase (TagB/SpsB family)
MKQARADDPGSGHRVEINALFADCDAMITDVSSVGLDFLYLATDKPLLLTDRHNDEEALLESAPVAAGSYLISGANVNGTETLLRDALASDTKATDRRRIRHYYFGDLAKGKSTAQFLAAVEEAIEVRDKWVRCRGAVVSRPHTSDEMVAGA